MDTVALICRLVLAAVFAVSSVTKLADMQRSVAAVRAFGVPERHARGAGVLLVAAELTAAVLLVPAATAGIGAAIALALLAAFVVAIAVNLARGKRPDCNCFGRVRSAPIGPGLLVRDLVLAAAAVVVLVEYGGLSG